jgi:thiamine-phosphate pyrophosphorylase
MKPLSECRLYAFVDTAYLRGRSAEKVALQLCDGGADLIQVRAKNSSLAQTREMAQSVLTVTQKAGVGLVINDHPAIAKDIGAELCHLGQEDFFGAGYTHVSQLCTPQSALRVGLSSHAPEQARRAMAAAAHYIAIGPVYATGTKPQAKPVSLDYVRWAAANVNIPWFAIGGINLSNLDEVLAAGATRICVVSAILNADDVGAACRAFRVRLES